MSDECELRATWMNEYEREYEALWCEYESRVKWQNLGLSVEEEGKTRVESRHP